MLVVCDLSQVPEKLVKLEPLSVEAFSPFGDVLGFDFKISRFDFGEGLLHMNYVRRPYQEFKFDSMEKHVGRQGFISMDTNPFAVIMAPSTHNDLPDINQMRAFIVDGSKAVVLKEGIWHVHDRFPLAPPESKMIVFCSVKMEAPDQTAKIDLREQYGVTGRLTI